MKLFEQLDADFIGLNEVTPNYLKIITSNKYIQTHYYISDVTGETINSEHGCLLLSKYPMKIFIKSIESLDRNIVIGELKLKNGENIVICVAHTLAFEINYLIRKFQLRKIFNLLDEYKNSSTLLIGDLNLHQDFEDEYIRDDYKVILMIQK